MPWEVEDSQITKLAQCGLLAGSAQSKDNLINFLLRYSTYTLGLWSGLTITVYVTNFCLWPVFWVWIKNIVNLAIFLGSAVVTRMRELLFRTCGPTGWSRAVSHSSPDWPLRDSLQPFSWPQHKSYQKHCQPKFSYSRHCSREWARREDWRFDRALVALPGRMLQLPHPPSVA